jgi:hypothetical protein
MIIFPLIRSVGFKAVTASSRVETTEIAVRKKRLAGDRAGIDPCTSARDVDTWKSVCSGMLRNSASADRTKKEGLISVRPDRSLSLAKSEAGASQRIPDNTLFLRRRGFATLPPPIGSFNLPMK